MKANELVIGQKYWCGWASRFARFVKIQKSVWCGKVSYKAVFRDVCDAIAECDIENVEKWVMTCEEFKRTTAPIAR